MPPPKLIVLPLTELPESVLLLTFNVPALLMPPPEATLNPLAIVRPSSVTVAPEALMLKTRVPLLPGRVNRIAPGPLIVRFLLITNSPVATLMGLARPAEKVIVLPGHA